MGDAAAIARLLADPDPGIASALRRQLVLKDEDPPGLREAVEELPDPAERSRAREARLEIGCERAGEKIIRGASEGMDLEDLTLLVARMEDPDADTACARKALDALADRVRAKVESATTARNRVLTIADFLGGDEHFEGNNTQEEFALGSSLPLVLERRRGLPIALSVVYMLVGKRVGIELFGVSAPLHFVVGAPVEEGTLYLDPFDRGRPLELDDLFRLLRELGVVSLRPEHVAPASTKAIVARMARNLNKFYASRPRSEARARRYARVAMALEDAL